MVLTEPSRRTIVQSVSVTHHSADDPLFPRVAFENGEVPPEIWQVHIQTREGLKPATYEIRLCLSEADALAFVERYPEGSEIDTGLTFDNRAQERDFIERTIDGAGTSRTLGAGDQDMYLPWQVLTDAGINAAHGLGGDSRVLNSLGKQRVAALKTRFQENWFAVAAFEFCWLNLPHSSPAFVAAACQYHYFVTQDDFSAGYLLRDLEVLVHDVEAEATKSRSARAKAGATGGERSGQSRIARRAALLDAMEMVAQRNPDFVKLGEKAVARLALEAACKDAPALWSQGKGQTDEYLGEIRRGEAGDELKVRYHALFPAKPLRRMPQ